MWGLAEQQSDVDSDVDNFEDRSLGNGTLEQLPDVSSGEHTNALQLADSNFAVPNCGEVVVLVPEESLSGNREPLRQLTSVLALQAELKQRLEALEHAHTVTSAEGYQEGFAAGTTQGKAEAVSIYLAEQRFTEQLLSRLIPQVTQIVEAVAREVVGETLAVTEMALANRVQRFFDSTADNPTVANRCLLTLRVSAHSDKAQLSALDKTLRERGQKTCEIRLSPQISPGYVEVETKQGSYVLDPSMQLEQLLHALRADPSIHDQLYRELLLSELCYAIREG